jgi:crotonobetainyl-CoA:carnitine CoA-transferase CaiB-like acyl-CoA transferase
MWVPDLSNIFTRINCTMILGDLGAEVFKVECPDTGDSTRTWGPPFAGGESASYLCYNRNKKSITIYLKNPRGGKLVKDLAKLL